LEIKNTYNCSHINKVQGKSTVKELTWQFVKGS
jgi:hypothetical protein